MMRSLFLALGMFVLLVGAECLLIDQVVLRNAPATPPASGFTASFKAPPPLPQGRKIQPPDWAPWSLLSAGAVTILYAIALPKRYGVA